jgi:hypothetical protein
MHRYSGDGALNDFRRSVRARTIVVVSVVLALTCCDANPPVGRVDRELPGTGRITPIKGVAITDVLGGLDPKLASLLRAAMGSVPSPLPPEAVSLVQFVSDGRDSPEGLTLGVPVDGILRTHFVVADPGSNSVRLNLLCLSNFHQVACTPSTSVWEVTLPPSSIVQAPVELPAKGGDRLDFLLVVEGDLIRPDLASQDSHLTVGAPSSPTAFDGTAPTHSAVFKGCDFATILPDVSPQTEFHLPGKKRLSQPLFLVVQPCAKGEVIRAVEVTNRTIAEPFPALASPVKAAGPVVLPITHPAGLSSGYELQIFVLRDRLPGWVTHPVEFIA